MPIDSDRKLKTLKTTRGKDIKIRYTQDNLEEWLVVQRQYFDNEGTELTPVTSLLLSRQVVGLNNPTIAHFGNSKPRYVSVCFGSQSNVLNESNFKVIVPYAPGDLNHNAHVNEIFAYISPSSSLNPSYPLSVSYQGESQF